MTDSSLPIPTPDPLALPGPPELFLGLLVLGFLLHALFMNLVLGGSLIMVMTDWVGRLNRNERYARLATTLSHMIPSAMALSIVLGVAPLLFVQLLYGNFFYTSTILIGNAWIGIILALILAYYGLYAYKYRRVWLQDQPGLYLAIGGTSVVLLLVVALVFVTVSVLMLNPERWREIQDAGFLGALSVRTVIPRFLHMFLASIAGTGIILVLYGAFMSTPWANHQQSDSWGAIEYRLWVTRYGVAWTLGGTVPQALVGPWLLLSLPQEVRAALLDRASAGSIVFFASLAIALVGLLLLSAALMAPHVRGLALGGVGSLTVTIVLMAIVRDRVRHHWLSPHLDLNSLAVEPQWGFIALFGVLFLGGLGVVGYLIHVYLRAQSATNSVFSTWRFK
ncbi:MAG: hypothetical protein ACE5NA_08495 [Nitrospiraceae bacterium]